MRWALVGVSLFTAAGLLGVSLDHGLREILWMTIAMTGMAIVFPLSLLLAVLKSGDAQQTRLLSIMMQSIGYVMAAFSPTILGKLFDLSGSWSKAMLFIVGLAAIQSFISFDVGKPTKIAL
jgi:CP family cyanate transporter-like MFS transporter